MRRILALAIAAASIGAVAAARPPVRVGLLPFDVTGIDGAQANAASAMAKVVRLQMLANKSLEPVLLDVPPGTKLPMAPSKAAALARDAGVDLVVGGTLLEAEVTHSSEHAGTWLGRVGVGGVGGSVSRVKATIRMSVELLDPADAKTRDVFDVDGQKTEIGVGSDLWTVLGTFDVGDNGWQKTPMGKALQQAADKLVAEVARRAAK